ncbi:flagellar export protein FliJ [Kistimonas asteriae]|uniref:flagellar export protein FliJ n=1 Tax=Kistimonas asteriae TaxID=517724 RepID=UPI001BAB3648|nr:flagellar FliJ family protein [Kistimonas asteriae]
MSTSVQLLEKCLDIQQQRYREAMKKALQSEQSLNQQRDQLTYLQQAINDYRTDTNTQVTPMSVVNLIRFRNLLQQVADLQHQRVNRGEEEYNQLSLQAAGEHRKLKAMEKLLEKMHQKSRLKLVKNEQKMLDDHAIRQYIDQRQDA